MTYGLSKFLKLTNPEAIREHLGLHGLELPRPSGDVAPAKLIKGPEGPLTCFRP